MCHHFLARFLRRVFGHHCMVALTLVALGATSLSACPVAVQSVQFVAAPQFAVAAPQVVQGYSVPLAVQSFAVVQPFYQSAQFYSDAAVIRSFGSVRIRREILQSSGNNVQVNVAGGARVRVNHGIFGGITVRIR